MLPVMLDEDRRRAGWSVGQAAWRLGVSIREYRELEAGNTLAELEDV
jgi:predicted transcriptional regulator